MEALRKHRMGQWNKGIIFSTFVLTILFSSAVFVGLFTTDAFADDTNSAATWDANTNSLTLSDPDGISAYRVTDAKTGDIITGASPNNCPSLTSVTITLAAPSRNGFNVDVRDCTGALDSITGVGASSGGSGGIGSKTGGNSDGSSGGGGNEKVDVCHKGKTITIPEKTLKSHLAHGDTAGPC